MTRKATPKVTISSSQKALRVPSRKLRALAPFVAKKEGHRLAELDIAVVGPGEIASLNRRWLARAGTTDVLSFDLSEGGGKGISAQLVICGDAAVAQARARGLKPQRELMLYVVHGLLHLMGYEDSSIRGAAKMDAREEALLAEFLAAPARRPRRVF